MNEKRVYDFALNFPKFVEVAKLGNQTLQLSHQRSGRVWITSCIAHNITNKIYNVEQGFPDNLDNSIKYFHSHIWDGHKFIPEVKYVLLIRDPRDVYCSYLHHIINLKVYNQDIWKDMSMCQAFVNRWRGYFQALEYNTLVVQYEHLCLYYERSLKRIINFAELTPRYKTLCLIPHFGQEHYEQHCLKWQRERNFTKEHAAIIWNGLKDIMPYYGYIENGHSPMIFNY